VPSGIFVSEGANYNNGAENIVTRKVKKRAEKFN
jgi:hypothetical protein